MKFSILLPHYRTGAMTAYATYQFLNNCGKHEVELIIGDNNAGDGSMAYLTPFAGRFKYIEYPKDLLQSHGVLFDYLLDNGHVSNEWFICVESDSFPADQNWLDYYEAAIKQGYDAAGSLMKLSGGVFHHVCGALYNQKVYREAKDYIKTIPYKYIDNILMYQDFPCHCMVHLSIWDDFLRNPQSYINLSESIKSEQDLLAKWKRYRPIAEGVFHNGMGGLQESLGTYGDRTIHTDPPHIIVNDETSKIIRRMGYEPGQFLSYFMIHQNRRILAIPTMTSWMKGRHFQQQEYTRTVNGFTHLWGVSSYHKANIEHLQDVIELKEQQVQERYESLPEHFKIITLSK